jgi:hypothetical protein
MPAISRSVNLITRTIRARETPYFTSPPPFPPFRQPDDTDDGDGLPFRVDPEDLHNDDDDLSAGTIAAIVVSVVVFFIILVGLIAYFNHRRRKARKIEIALKEESVSVTTATASGALDPPPPYDEVHLDTRHPVVEQRWDSRSEVSGVSEEEDSDAMGSHATVTDGLAPERHSGSGVS